MIKQEAVGDVCMSVAETRQVSNRSPAARRSRHSSDLIILKVAGEAYEIQKHKKRSRNERILNEANTPITEIVCDRHYIDRGSKTISNMTNDVSRINTVENFGSNNDR